MSYHVYLDVVMKSEAIVVDEENMKAGSKRDSSFIGGLKRELVNAHPIAKRQLVEEQLKSTMSMISSPLKRSVDSSHTVSNRG